MQETLFVMEMENDFGVGHVIRLFISGTHIQYIVWQLPNNELPDYLQGKNILR